MIKEKYPEIITSDISSQILTIISVLVENEMSMEKLSNKEFDANKIDLLQKISLESLKNNIEKCYTLGMITEKEYKSEEILGGEEGIILNIDIGNNVNRIGVEKTKKIKKINNSNKMKEIDLNKYTLTAIGKVSNLLSIPIMHSKIILSGLAWEASIIDLISIIAFIGMEARDLKVKTKYGAEQINWNYIIEKSNMMQWIKSDLSKIRERILLGGDMIRGIFLIEAILEIGKNKNICKVHEELQIFCKKAKLNLENIINLIGMREELINTLLSAGIDIYAMEKYRIKNVIPEEFNNTIIKIKYCIYEGFKLQIAWLDEKNMKYKIQHGGLQINVPTMFDNNDLTSEEKEFINWKTLPKAIMYDKLDINPTPDKNNIYKVKFNYIEMCDGWINIDDNN
jgi:hypothetical protein